MIVMRASALAGWLVGLVLVAAPATAQDEDVFAFIPDGGRTLLGAAFEDAPAAEIEAILSGTMSREDWLAHLESRTGAIPGLGDLDEHQLLTLADYLSFNMPLAAERVPADPAKADWLKLLPLDGRDLALNECQFCHIITVVVTQEKTKNAWLGTMNKPSHIEIELSETEREALASYLVLNAAIPADLVPEDLRAGGASY